MSDLTNLAWLRTEVAYLLNFNPAETDQAFAGSTANAYASIDRLINQALTKEYNQAKLEIGLQPFTCRASLTWPASQQTLTIPKRLLHHQIIQIDDETDTTPGVTLWVGNDGGKTTTIGWRDKDTLLWGNTGPGSDRSLTVFFVAHPSPLTQPAETPELIPSQYRYLIVWSAAILGRAIADEGPPPFWLAQLQEWRSQYYLAFSRGQIIFPAGYTVIDTDMLAFYT